MVSTAASQGDASNPPTGSGRSAEINFLDLSPQFKDMYVRWNGNFKLIMSMNGCLGQTHFASNVLGWTPTSLHWHSYTDSVSVDIDCGLFVGNTTQEHGPVEFMISAWIICILHSAQTGVHCLLLFQQWLVSFNFYLFYQNATINK